MYAWPFTDLFDANNFVVFFCCGFLPRLFTRKRFKCPEVLILRLGFLIRLHANLELKQEVVHFPIIRCKTKQKSSFTTSHGWEKSKLQALVYDILPLATAVLSYAIGSRKLSANEQFFVGAQTVVSLLQIT